MLDQIQANKLFAILDEVVDQPLVAPGRRILFSAHLTNISLEFGAAARLLCDAGTLIGAATCLRSQFEGLVRSVWLLHCATDEELESLDTGMLTREGLQQSSKLPMASKMLSVLGELRHLDNLMVGLNEFKESSWVPLNSFVHSGVMAVHGSRFGSSPKFLETTFRSSNGLSVLAYMQLAILQGIPGGQREVLHATTTFASILPPRRQGC